MPMYDFNPYNQNFNLNPYFRPQSISGKLIGRIDDVMVSDVPADGQCGVFPLTDYSTIYVKKWNANGTISTIAYKPQIDAIPEETSNLSNNENKSLYGAITKQLEDINAKITKLMEGNYEYEHNNTVNDPTVAK